MDAVTPARGRWAWAIWVAWAGLALLFIAVSLQKIWAGDFWGQLRNGEWILSHWAWPRADEYSFTAAGREVREVRWLYCVAVALGWKVGAWALCMGQVVLLGAVWAMLAWRVRWVLRTSPGLLVLALGIAGGAGRWVQRPELVSDLMMALFLVGLEGAAGGGTRAVGIEEHGRARRLASSWRGWWLVLAQIVWVNGHSLAVFGPILAWVFAGSVAVEGVFARLGVRWPEGAGARRLIDAGWLAALAAAVTGAMWVNPYGTRGALYALELWRESRAGSVVGEAIGELRSPLAMPLAMWTWDLWAAVVLVVVVAASFVLNWRRAPVVRWVVFAMGVYLFLGAQRNACWLAVMGTWAGLRNVADVVESEEHGRARRLASSWHGAGALLGAACAAMAWYVMTDRSAIAVGAPKEFGIGVVEWDTPKGAADFVVASGVSGRVFNGMRDGNYLGWRSRGAIKVFIDGRTDVYGDALVAEFAVVGSGNWDATADKWGIRTAILPVRGFEDLVGFLRKKQGWALVYLDHRNVVFVREAPEHGAAIAKYRIDAGKAWVAGEEPDQKPEWWKRAIGGPGRPWYTQGMAETFLALGSLENSRVYLERTLKEFPEWPRARAELAAVARFQGRNEESDGLLRGMSVEWRGFSDRMLVAWLVEAGRKEEAARALERAVVVEPRDARLRVVLADQYFQAGDFARAKGEYEEAARLGHDAAAEWLKLGFACQRTGDGKGAVRAYRKSLEKDAGQYQVWNQLGMVLGSQGDRAGAAECFERALKIKPDFEGARKNLEAVRGRR